MANYKNENKAELIMLCGKRGIKTSSRMTKEALIALLEKDDKATAKKVGEKSGSKKESTKSKKKSLDKSKEKKPEQAKEKASMLSKEPKEGKNNGKPKEKSRRVYATETIPDKQRDAVRQKTRKELAEERKRQKESPEAPKFKERVFRADSNYRMTIDAKDRYKKGLRPQSTGESELLESENQKKRGTDMVLTGEFDKIAHSDDPVYMNGEYRDITYVVADYKGTQVYIPTDVFFLRPEVIAKEELEISVHKRMMDNAKIDFIVVGHAPDKFGNMRYYGSRVAAMKKTRHDFWYGKERRGKEILGYALKAGEIYDAKVVAVTKRSIFIELFGAETKIRVQELAYEKLNDAHKLFEVGDIIPVFVTEIIRAEEDEAESLGYPIRFEASHKATFEDPRIVNFDKYNIGDVCVGIVTGKDPDPDNNYWYVNVRGQIDVRCDLKKGVHFLPQDDDKVAIRIAGKNPSKFFIWGRISHVYPKKERRD